MSFDTLDMTIREIQSPRDAAWTDWKSIYYDSFPENERMTEEYFRNVLERKAAKSAPDEHMLVMTPRDAPEQVLGIAYYERDEEARAGLLWYLALRSGSRSRGYGAVFYADIMRRLKESGATLLLFEVEIPHLAREEGPERGTFAERRIAWYQRQGALLLGGVRHIQSVDAPVPPIEMHVMAQPFVDMTAEQVYQAASKLFGKSIEQTGRLTLM